jgi:hypothetical protein
LAWALWCSSNCHNPEWRLEVSTKTDQDSRRGYSAEQIARFRETLGTLRDAQVVVRSDLAILAEQLQVGGARAFSTEGLGRRIKLIERAVHNVFAIYPPDRTEFLTFDECDDVALQFQAFGMHVYALFDNIAWVCLLEAGGSLPPLRVGALKSECQAFMPQRLRDYLNNPTVSAWFNQYGKVYRDSTAHRIPPYLPSRNFTSEEGARWRKLHEESMGQLLGAATSGSRQQRRERLRRHEELVLEKEALGSNSLFVAISMVGEPSAPLVYLHPQMLSDWGLAHELLQAFTGAMRAHHGWQSPQIPLLHAA